MSEISHDGESLQSPEEKRREKIKKNYRELLRRREAQELDAADYRIEFLFYLQEEDRPLTRGTVGNKAVVLTQSDLEQLGYLEIVLPNGQIMSIEPEDTGYAPDDLLIIFPEDLGELDVE